jgi:Gpi18-like mannosyltransferase
VLINLPHTQPKGYRTYDEEFYSPASIAQNGITTSTREEYEPRWVQARTKYTGDGILTPTPLIAVRELSRSSIRHEYAVTSPALATVRDSTYYYPGWTVLIDGNETAVSPAPMLGAISFQVPPGNHTVTIELRPTMVRRIAPIISILTLGILLIAVAASRIGTEYVDATAAAGAAKNPDSAPVPSYLLIREHWNKLGESPNLMTPTGAMLTAALGVILLSVGLEFIAAPPGAGPSGKIAGLFAGVVMLAIVGYTLARYLRPLATDRRSGFRSALVILAVIAAAKIVLVPFFPGFAVDVNDYQSWAMRIASVGPAHTYEPGFFLDYPPGYLYGLWIAGWIARAVGASGELLRLIVESPALVGDFVLGALVFAFVGRERSSTAAIALTLVVALNPALLYDTVVWGQTDSVLTFTMLLSIAALMSDQYELCFAIAAISVLIKPQELMLLPVLSLWMLRHFGPREWIRSALAFTAVALIGIAPFQIGHAWNWIIVLYTSTAAFYRETSVNAFNLLALLGGLRTPDSNTFAGISYYTLGMTLLVPLYAFVAWIVWTGRSKQRLLFASFITVFGFFMLAPRMHERYIYPAIALAAPLALEAPVMTAVFAILTFTGLVNLAYILHTLQKPVFISGLVGSLDPRDGIAMAVSALNLAVLAMVVYYGATRVGVLSPKVTECDLEPVPDSAPAGPV